MITVAPLALACMLAAAPAPAAVEWLSPLPADARVPGGAVVELFLRGSRDGVSVPVAAPVVRASGGDVVVTATSDRLLWRVLARAGSTGVLVLDAQVESARAELALPIDDSVLGSLQVALDVPLLVKRGDGPQRALVRITGTPGAAPRAATTTGSLSPLRQVAPGSWETELIPGDAPWPEVAIVSAWRNWPDARSPAASFASTTLALASAIILPGETRPNVDVTVQIEGRTFGPVKSDARGHFEIPVVVPPGVRFGTGISVDKLGNRRVTSIDLHVPPLTRLALVPFSDAAVVGGFGVGVGVVALDKSGAPAKEAPVLRAQNGVVVDVRSLGDGRTLARYRPSSAPARDVLSARLRDGTEVQAAIDTRGGAPSALLTDVTPRVLTAPSSERGRVGIRATDRGGAVIGDAVIETRAQHGVTQRWSAPGHASRIDYAPPSRRASWEDTLIVVARAPAGLSATRLAWDGASIVAVDAADRPVPRATVRVKGGAVRADASGVLPLSIEAIASDAVFFDGAALPARLLTRRDEAGKVHIAPRIEPAVVARVEIALADPVPVDVRASWAEGAVRWRIVGAKGPRALRITSDNGASIAVNGTEGVTAAPGPAPLFVQDVESGVAAVLFAP